MTRRRWLVAGALVAVIAIVLGAWWRTGGTAKPAATADKADEVAARDDGASGPRRSLGKDRHVGAPRAAGDVLVAGKVVDASGAGVSGVDVIFGRKTDETVTSGHDGAFEIALPAGGYEVRALGERQYAQARVVEVGATDEPLVIEVAELAAARGWVIDAAGKPVAGATITVGVRRSRQSTVDKDGVLQGATTDTNGVFEVDLLPGFNRIIADHPAGNGHLDLERVPPGEREEDLRITLAPYLALSGIVRSPDGVGLSGAEVTVTIRDTAFRRGLSATAGDGGRFTIPELVPGEATIDARLDGYAPADPQHVKIVAGETPAEVTLTLAIPVTLTGKVVDADGEPLYDAKVKVQRDGSDNTFRAARTDSDGTFEVTGLDPGPHTVTVEVDRRARLSKKLTSIPGTPVDLQIEP